MISINHLFTTYLLPCLIQVIKNKINYLVSYIMKNRMQVNHTLISQLLPSINHDSHIFVKLVETNV